MPRRTPTKDRNRARRRRRANPPGQRTTRKRVPLREVAKELAR